MIPPIKQKVWEEGMGFTVYVASSGKIKAFTVLSVKKVQVCEYEGRASTSEEAEVIILILLHLHGRYHEQNGNINNMLEH